ncbi:hypothetical protein IW261DRAFT_1016817 [Armillaria novae-zelandiae]|uniref:Uncharacterized protein n=1 Tax=Armillaria novae-zelandiae TaxID=153914 RepID=A0AA39NN74_9AGAR|nr:hypothetical protein IW261DRAFT_1016817 [Armillaria novae-zelandiae]
MNLGCRVTTAGAPLVGLATISYTWGRRRGRVSAVRGGGSTQRSIGRSTWPMVMIRGIESRPRFLIRLRRSASHRPWSSLLFPFNVAILSSSSRCCLRESGKKCIFFSSPVRLLESRHFAAVHLGFQDYDASRITAVSYRASHLFQRLVANWEGSS